MRFYTIEAGQKRSKIELLTAGDDLMIGVISDDGNVEGIPLSPFMAAGARQLELAHLVEGTVAQTPDGPTISTFKRRESKGPVREPDGPCIVLVKTTGVLTSSMFIDAVEDGRVVRSYLGASDMAGVQVLAHGVGQFLLELLPQASFRVEAEAGTLTVRWPGWDVPPPRFSKDQATLETWERYEARRQGLQVKVFTERREAPQEQATG